jgi:glycosyltransferase involved in cell wall biosynthesis
MGLMDISFVTMPGSFNLSMGYGNAAFNMLSSLKELGHKIPYNDPNAPVQVAFCQPPWYKFNPGQYKIGYTPWESTDLPHGWLDPMNECDEIWTTSPLIAKWYREAGITPPIYVYEHGIDPIWKPKDRRKDPSEPIKFLHVGEPAPRKAGQLAFNSFMDAFGPDDTSVSFTIKAIEFSTVRWKDHKGSIIRPMGNIPNFKDDIRDLPIEELVEVFHDHDVLVYPSWGEGFGLIPLQALATGMPVICTEAWAPYSRFFNGLGIRSELVNSPWPTPHDGKMFKPDRTHISELMMDVAENYNHYAGLFYDQAEQVHDEYNWTNLTKRAYQHIVDKFEE